MFCPTAKEEMQESAAKSHLVVCLFFSLNSEPKKYVK